MTTRCRPDEPTPPLGRRNRGRRPPARRRSFRRRPHLALMPLLLLGLAGPLLTPPARAEEGCPPDSLIFALGNVLRRQAVQPTLIPQGFSWGPLGRASVVWQIDPVAGQSQLGAHGTSGELVHRDRFEVAAGAPGEGVTTRLVLHVHLQGRASDEILHGAAIPPAGRFFARLEAPGGMRLWETPFVAPGMSAMDLVSEPFSVLAGETFEVAWSLGVDNEWGGSELTGYLSFEALSDTGIGLVPCEGPPVALTPTRGTTWGAIKAIFR